jgi:Ca-activated chloride channel family protein
MKASHWLTALIGVFLFALAGQAQGIIIPRPCPRPEVRCPTPMEIPQRPLKVKSIRFNAKITDQVAVTHVEQVFENDTPYLLEGVYFFPLPDGVSITEFAMWDGDKRLVGEARQRDEARRIYNDIVRSRRDPALLEYAGKNLFQASVFPIQPHSDKKIELTYSQVLRNEGGTVAYRYPLGTGWQSQAGWQPAPRPWPRPLGESDPENPQARPGGSSIGQISAVVEISSKAAIKGVYSPSHEIDVKRDGERKARLSFETRGGAQADFQLFYSFSDQDFGLSLLTYRDPGKDGYFLLLVSPKAGLDDREVSAKDVVFVLDTSGSMAEEGKIDKAKAALRHGVSSLNPRDRFNVISFAGEERLMSERLITADDDGRKQALEFIERMRATGGTNINDALMAAFKQIQAGDRPRMIVLLTDGQPTVGETKAGAIFANVKQAIKQGVRLFTFGVGYDVNTVLLDGLANENRGTVGYIEPKEDIEVKVSNFFAKVNNPVLSEVKIDWGGVDTDLVYPRATPDIFHGSQLVLMGRYRPRPSANRLTLTGKVNGRERAFVYDDLKFPEKQGDNEFLPHLWAMRRVGHLLDQIRLNGESKELRDEIVELGTRYGIVTPYTSYLVLEPEARALRFLGAGASGGVGGALNGRQPAPTPLPTLVPAPTAAEQNAQRTSGRMDELSAVSNEIRRRERAAQETADNAIIVTGTAGKDAVTFSKEKEELRKAESLATKPSLPDQIRQVAGKTFYLRDGVWTDGEFKAEDKLPVVKLKFASDEYFDLIGKEPKLAECFALGQRVVVVWKGKIYQVEE